MDKTLPTQITVQTTIKATREKVWQLFTDPAAVKEWNSASPDWHTTRAENDLREGGKFSFRMEAKDGSFGFDFAGVYDDVEAFERIAYTMADGRKVIVEFSGNTDTHVRETFDAESTNSVDMQRSGWQAILDNFKKFVERK